MKVMKIVDRRQKRLGRGYGSGKGGHTVGRGQKGQKARGGLNILFEGMKVKKSLLHRLPFVRGKGKFKAFPKPVIVAAQALNALPAGTKVTIETLVDAGLVDARDAKKYGVKILGGRLTKTLDIKLPKSRSVAGKPKSQK